MRDGEFEDGKMCLRAKIDMSSSNINMRDPTIYRIRRATHVKTGGSTLSPKSFILN
jgi:glutaminyl-tRNA synthetase